MIFLSIFVDLGLLPPQDTNSHSCSNNTNCLLPGGRGFGLSSASVRWVLVTVAPAAPTYGLRDLDCAPGGAMATLGLSSRSLKRDRPHRPHPMLRSTYPETRPSPSRPSLAISLATTTPRPRSPPSAFPGRAGTPVSQPYPGPVRHTESKVVSAAHTASERNHCRNCKAISQSEP